MADPQPIRFQDGAAYEQTMGKWSHLVGGRFLDWVAPPAGLAWVDVGCGNGAFTELLIERCAPSSVDGIDPSEGQLAFARTRAGAAGARFQLGDATALPYADDRFDAAVMALVIFFVPDPVKGVAEMRRVVKPGGLVAAYAWDITRGGAPFEPIWDEMRRLGVEPAQPPSKDVSRMEVLAGLWRDAGLRDVETMEIVVERSFASFEHFWTVTTAHNVNAAIEAMTGEQQAELKARVRARMPSSAAGRVAFTSKANAVKGRVE